MNRSSDVELRFLKDNLLNCMIVNTYDVESITIDTAFNFSCFFSLLLIAFVAWKLKQRYDLYRRSQVPDDELAVSICKVVLFVMSTMLRDESTMIEIQLFMQRHIQELAQMASRPFATCMLDVDTLKSYTTPQERQDVRASSRRKRVSIILWSPNDDLFMIHEICCCFSHYSNLTTC